jgi:hypothetical protein
MAFGQFHIILFPCEQSIEGFLGFDETPPPNQCLVLGWVFSKM